MSSPSTLLVRADASASMGMGHVLRTLALAHAWQDRGGDVVLATVSAPARVLERMSRERVSVIEGDVVAGTDEDLAWTLREAKARGAVCVVDGYHLGPRFANALVDAGHRALLVDDDGTDVELRCAVLNQNLHGARSRYPRARAAVLGGTRYAMLRRELLARPRRAPVAPPAVARELVVSFGGADPERLSAPSVRAIEAAEIEGARATVIIGPAAAAQGPIESSRIALEVLVDPPALFDLFERAELAIVAAGSTIWELAYLGVPMLLASTAPNQEPTLAAAVRAGMARSVGDAATFRSAPPSDAIAALARDASARASLIAEGRARVDGWGSARVAAVLAGETSDELVARDFSRQEIP